MRNRGPRAFIVESNAYSVGAVMQELFKRRGIVVGIAGFEETALLSWESILKDRESLNMIIVAARIGQEISSGRVRYNEICLGLVSELRDKFYGIIVGGARNYFEVNEMKRAGCDDAVLHQGCGGFTGEETARRALELWQASSAC